VRKGENRAELKKGDCVDCNQCVVVCPTGIDIRNGTQLECINCACCIDACNSVMKRVGFKPGLIRYASEKMLSERKSWHFTFRSGAYTVVLTALLIAFSYFLITRNPVEATVLRSPGMLFQEQEGGRISNLYSMKIVNKTNQDLPLEIRLMNAKGEVQIIGPTPRIAKQTLGEIVFFVIMDRNEITRGKKEIEIGAFSGGKELDKTNATFVGPTK
jgi:cytochrome c oxidase accessory protein FixG